MNTIDFHKSTAKELLAIKHRVRNLINHWGEDGRYKEAVVRTVIQRFLPDRYRIGTGFVVRQTSQRGDHEPSNQIDLIIYDTSFPVLFRESDFVILTPDSVSAIIEIKANVTNQGLQGVVQRSNRIGKFIYEGRTDKSQRIFNGIFSFDSGINNLQNLCDAIESEWTTLIDVSGREKFAVNHISFNEHWFYKFWEDELLSGREPHLLYEIQDLSFSFFISNLMDWISGTSVIENSNLWFPVDKSIQIRNKF